MFLDQREFSTLGFDDMNPELRNMILEAQRETRLAEGRPTPEDVKTQRQFDDMKTIEKFAGFNLRIATASKIEPVAEWTGSAAVARFTIDNQPFTILKDTSEFVLLAGDEHGQELTRIDAKPQFPSTQKFLSALGDFFSISAKESPQ
jgi:hypothetical protein